MQIIPITIGRLSFKILQDSCNIAQHFERSDKILGRFYKMTLGVKSLVQCKMRFTEFEKQNVDADKHFVFQIYNLQIKATIVSFKNFNNSKNKTSIYPLGVNNWSIIIAQRILSLSIQLSGLVGVTFTALGTLEKLFFDWLVDLKLITKVQLEGFANNLLAISIANAEPQLVNFFPRIAL